MKKVKGIIIALLCCALFFVLSALYFSGKSSSTAVIAQRLEKTIGARFSKLEAYVHGAQQRLPSDMVIYNYENDSLKSWRNVFPILNDDISSKVLFNFLANPRISIHSPLSDITDSVSFVNLGPKWYLLKSYDTPEGKTIAGLEILDEYDSRSFNGVNPHLHLADQFTIKPISFNGGDPVFMGRTPMFKVMYAPLRASRTADAQFVALALLCLVAAGFIYLCDRKTIKRYLVFLFGLVASFAVIYFWGRTAQNDLKLFSPLLYADGKVFYSLGAVLTICLAIVFAVWGLFIVRRNLCKIINEKGRQLLFKFSLFFIAAGILFFVNVILKSIAINSGINLELYKFEDLDEYTLLVYLCLIAVLLCIPMLVRMMSFNSFSKASRTVFAALSSLYIVSTTALLGFGKEQDKLDVWANRLAVERDIQLEMHLLMAQRGIESDQLLASLAVLDNTQSTILNRITDMYLTGVSQNYDVSVRFVKPGNNRSTAYFNGRILGAEPIFPESSFLFSSSSNGMSRYTGVFQYYNSRYGLNTVLLCIDPKESKVHRGYSSILGISVPGQVTIPFKYSYAKYKDGSLRQFRGNYAYPSHFDYKSKHFSKDGYSHFVTKVTPEETVIISRPHIGYFKYSFAFLFVGLVAYFTSALPILRRRERNYRERSYYKTRIKVLMMGSLALTLASMTAVSVVFVFNRNEENLEKLMSDKINSIQALIQDAIKTERRTEDMLNPDFRNALETISGNTGSDISIFTPEGKIFISTTPDLYDRQLLQGRMNEDAYSSIMVENRRYSLHKEKMNGENFYNMYAPVLDRRGQVMAILCVPYSEGSYTFEKDAAIHLVAILTLFVLLLILANTLVTKVVERLFRPLSEIGTKMASTSINNLDYIQYNNEDEVSNLVSSYNGMVTELTESTKKLAQAERDKAWSGMARQVAHEIKNPLTPMKLQIQRMVRLRQKGDENWNEKFDEATGIILEHIDILTETANEFSDFAKLYSEPSVELDLDKILQSEISMFDNRDDVHFDYMGLSGSMVQAPKPQLTRVFVNLLGNAVQAVEGVKDARILVSLRNSSSEGFFDIVFEDNGPGVLPENIEKLFTPNFTTKSSGSGLGLAISKSILEKCGATLTYSKSFSLGGACFTICYPKG